MCSWHPVLSKAIFDINDSVFVNPFVAWGRKRNRNSNSGRGEGACLRARVFAWWRPRSTQVDAWWRSESTLEDTPLCFFALDLGHKSGSWRWLTGKASCQWPWDPWFAGEALLTSSWWLKRLPRLHFLVSMDFSDAPRHQSSNCPVSGGSRLLVLPLMR